jgi:sugar lactone lactonase YvrE
MVGKRYCSHNQRGKQKYDERYGRIDGFAADAENGQWLAAWKKCKGRK